MFLFFFFWRVGGGGGSCFVVRDLFRSGCRQNYYLTPLPPPPNCPAFFRLYPQFSLTHSYLKLVRAYDITARDNDLIDNDQRSSPLFRQCCPRKWVHTATRHSLHTLLHRSIIRKQIYTEDINVQRFRMLCLCERFLTKLLTDHA